MPEENATAKPPSSSPTTASSASVPRVPSSREYIRAGSSPAGAARKFEAAWIGTLSGSPGSVPGRPPAITFVRGSQVIASHSAGRWDRFVP